MTPVVWSTSPGPGSSGRRPTSRRRTHFVDFLLSAEAQTYFAEETFEIPVADGVQPVEGVPTLDEVTLATVDLNELDDLAGTLTLLTELGIL